MLRTRLSRVSTFVFLLLLTTACTAVSISPSRMPSTLNPQGPGAARLAELWWVMLAVAMLTYLLVLALLFAALLRRRRGTSATAPDSHGGDTGRGWVIWGGIVLPLVVIGIAFGYSIYTQAAIDNQAEERAFKIEIFGRRWWWEVRYLDHGF